MVNERNVQLIAFHARRRLRWHYIRNKAGRRLRPAGELPSQDIEKAARVRGVGIEETLPVKVARKWQCARAMLHESLFTHNSARVSIFAASCQIAGITGNNPLRRKFGKPDFYLLLPSGVGRGAPKSHVRRSWCNGVRCFCQYCAAEQI